MSTIGALILLAAAVGVLMFACHGLAHVYELRLRPSAAGWAVFAFLIALGMALTWLANGLVS